MPMSGKMHAHAIDCTLVAPLPAAVDPRLAGNKAATLATLLAAGFPVPDGFVVLTTAFERAAGGPGDPSRGDLSPPVSLPVAVAEAIGRFAAELAGAAVAVRSSAVDEDLPGRSYAGQYDTVLGV